MSKAGRKALFPGHKALLYIVLSPWLMTESPENMCQTTREGQQGLTWKEKLKGGLFHSKHYILKMPDGRWIAIFRS